MEAAGICHSDLNALAGRSQPPGWPLIPGHEGLARVEKVGSDVSSVAPGDRVLFSFVASCRRCFWCIRGQDSLCICFRAQAVPKGTLAGGEPVFGHAGLGAFAEQALVDERALVPVSSQLDAAQLCLVSCAVTTGMSGVFNASGLQAGDTVAVIGLGGVGQAATRAAHLAGAGGIVVVDPVEARRNAALRLGATSAAASKDDAAECLRVMTGGRGADIALEAAGSKAAAADAYELTRRGGTIVILGAPPRTETPPWSLYSQMTDSKTVRGALYGGAVPRRDFARLVAFAESGRLDLDGMVGQRISLEEVSQGIAAMSHGAGRAVITF
jgi:S-(hydroxymethyl)glutathione dehydrogenase/alcohol dehydrogenase